MQKSRVPNPKNPHPAPTHLHTKNHHLTDVNYILRRTWNQLTPIRFYWVNTLPKLMPQKSPHISNPPSPPRFQQPSTLKGKRPAFWRTMTRLNRFGMSFRLCVIHEINPLNLTCHLRLGNAEISSISPAAPSQTAI